MLMDSCSKSLIGSGTHKCTVNVRTQKRAGIQLDRFMCEGGMRMF